MTRPGILLHWPRTTTPIHEVGASRVRTYECAGCGKVGPWDDGWMWYGALNALDGGYGSRQPEPMVVVCSRLCAQLAGLPEIVKFED